LPIFNQVQFDFPSVIRLKSLFQRRDLLPAAKQVQPDGFPCRNQILRAQKINGARNFRCRQLADRGNIIDILIDYGLAAGNQLAVTEQGLGSPAALRPRWLLWFSAAAG